MIMLVARMIWNAIAVHKRTIVTGGAAVAIGDVINLDWLRQQAIRIAPGSDREALEEASRLAARLLGLEGDEVLWPRQRNGEPITPKYMIIDLNRGRAWYSTRYYSRKSVNAGRRRGFGRGVGAGRRQAVQTAQISRG